MLVALGDHGSVQHEQHDVDRHGCPKILQNLPGDAGCETSPRVYVFGCRAAKPPGETADSKSSRSGTGILDHGN